MSELKRYGYAAPTDTRPSEMADGYWTPWHIAQAEVDRLRAAISELAAAQSDIAQADALGPDFKDYQRDIAAARLRQAKAIIGLCAEARATGQQQPSPASDSQQDDFRAEGD